MEILVKVLGNTSLWEVMLLAALIYLLSIPEFRKRIKVIKFGNFELELESLKEELKKDREKIAELEEEVENDRRLFDDILNSFDPNAPVSELAAARQTIKSEAKNLSEIDSLRKYLSLKSSPEELFVAAVTIREKRPVPLLSDLISFLEEVANESDLGGFRLNTIWTLTSALHLTLISCIRDGVGEVPDKLILEKGHKMLKVLTQNPQVQQDRPDNPTKGIRGPAKHALNWIEKGIKSMPNKPLK